MRGWPFIYLFKQPFGCASRKQQRASRGAAARAPELLRPRDKKTNAHPSGEPRPGCTRGLPERGNTASSRGARGQPAPGRSPPARRGRGKRSAGSARRAQPSPAGARGRPGWVPAASGHPPGLAPPQALRARAAGRGARRENGRRPLSPEESRCGRAGGSPAPLPVTFKRVYV